MAKGPWYKDGLPFECSECGECCSGGPGYVWVNQEEIDALSEAVGCAGSAEFERRFVRKIGIRRSLKERRNYDCVLLDARTRKCTAYEARPRQCRTWPFWDSNLASREAWLETCVVCPGAGTGPLVQLDEIEAQRKVIHV